ncbi:MAG: DUF5915 domain-containing protein, partial [Bacteroidota bacterium]
IAEGGAREFVNRIQNMRKDARFAVTDRIAIFFEAPPGMRETLQNMGDYVKRETLAVDLCESASPGEYAATFEINGEALRVAIERRN